MPIEQSAATSQEKANLDQARVILASALREILASSLTNPLGLEGIKAWNELKKFGPSVVTSLALLDQLTALNHVYVTQPFNGEVCLLIIDQTEQKLNNLGRVGELLKLVMAQAIGREQSEVSPQTARAYQAIQTKTNNQLPVDVIGLLTSEKVPLTTKAAWFSKSVLPAVQYLQKLDQKEAEATHEEQVRQPGNITKTESPQSQPNDVRNGIAVGMSDPGEFEPNRTGIHFTVSPFGSGYFRTSTNDRWNHDSLSFSKSNLKMKLVVEVKNTPTPLRKTVHGIIPTGSLIGLPIKQGYLPVSLKTADSNLKLFTTSIGDYLLDGANFSHPIEFWAQIDKISSGKNKTKDEPMLLNDFSRYEISPELDDLLKKWKKEAKDTNELAGLILHWVRTNFSYSTDAAISSWYKDGDPNGFFARIENQKLADCDVANTFFIFLLGRVGIPAALIEGYYVDKPDLSGTAVLGSHNPHAWTLLWDGHSLIEADATPTDSQHESDDSNDNGDSNREPNSEDEEKLAEILSEEEIEEIIQAALENLCQEEFDESQKVNQFAQEAGCDEKTARQVVDRLERARLKKNKSGKLLQSLMRDAWLKLQRTLEIPKTKTRKVRLSEGGELDDEVELELDLFVKESDPGGFIKKEKRIITKPTFDGVDVFLVADKSLSMEDPDPTTGQPKRVDQQVLAFLLLDSLHSASKLFAKKLGKKAADMEIRSALITFGAVDGRNRAINPKVELPLSNSWGSHEQLTAYRALEENFGGSTPDYAGLSAVRRIIEEDAKIDQAKKRRLRLTILVTDGGSDSPRDAQKERDEFESGGLLLRAAGIGPDAKKVIQTYGHSGRHLPSFDDAYDWLTKEVIEAASHYLR